VSDLSTLLAELCEVCGKPAKWTFSRERGLPFHRCKKHGKALIMLEKHGTMAIPKGRK
jgi:hypothetical protein